MGKKFTVSGLGVILSLGEASEVLEPIRSIDADQINPKGFYVYAHCDLNDKIFYIGKGTKKRAWSKVRHSLWSRYVEKHLNNDYKIVILVDNLKEEEAEFQESLWMSYYGSILVNWANYGREVDFEALDRHHAKVAENKMLIQSAKTLEKIQPEKAIKMYITAIENISLYCWHDYEKGLVADLRREEMADNGLFGEVEAIERLVMVLLSLGRYTESLERFNNYFNAYQGDKNRASYEKTLKRIEKFKK